MQLFASALWCFINLKERVRLMFHSWWGKVSAPQPWYSNWFLGAIVAFPSFWGKEAAESTYSELFQFIWSLLFFWTVKVFFLKYLSAFIKMLSEVVYSQLISLIVLCLFVSLSRIMPRRNKECWKYGFMAGSFRAEIDTEFNKIDSSKMF